MHDDGLMDAERRRAGRTAPGASPDELSAAAERPTLAHQADSARLVLAPEELRCPECRGERRVTAGRCHCRRGCGGRCDTYETWEEPCGVCEQTGSAWCVVCCASFAVVLQDGTPVCASCLEVGVMDVELGRRRLQARLALQDAEERLRTHSGALLLVLDETQHPGCGAALSQYREAFSQWERARAEVQALERET